jgi:hypothetical protein
MHFHLPKPLHGWREFAGEVGIIVVGVLIALGAEQGVEKIHHKADLEEAERAMVVELRDDDLPQAYTRAAIFGCYADQLDAVERAVASGDRAKTLQLARDYRPVFRTWDDQAWQAAIASQVLVNAGAKRMQRWSTAYVAMPQLGKTATDERDELPYLWANLSGTGPLSAGQQDRLFQVISVQRRYNRLMSGMSLVLLRFAGDAGVALTPETKAALRAEARRTYGACVSDPSAARLDMQNQLSFSSDAQLGRR